VMRGASAPQAPRMHGNYGPTGNLPLKTATATVANRPKASLTRSIAFTSSRGSMQGKAVRAGHLTLNQPALLSRGTKLARKGVGFLGSTRHNGRPGSYVPKH
jgi:hypothetical protein